MNKTGEALFCTKPSLPDGLVINYNRNGNICDLSLTNTSDKNVKVGDLTVCSTNMPFAPDTKFFGEGYRQLQRLRSLQDFAAHYAKVLVCNKVN